MKWLIKGEATGRVSPVVNIPTARADGCSYRSGLGGRRDSENAANEASLPPLGAGWGGGLT